MAMKGLLNRVTAAEAGDAIHRDAMYDFVNSRLATATKDELTEMLRHMLDLYRRDTEELHVARPLVEAINNVVAASR